MVEEITPNPCALEVLQPRAFAASASTAQSDIAQINEHICVPHIMPVHLFSRIYLKILPGCTTLASDPCQHRTCCLILKHFLEINTLHQLHKGLISVKGPALTSQLCNYGMAGKGCAKCLHFDNFIISTQKIILYLDSSGMASPAWHRLDAYKWYPSH